ncbi:hypothetical protein [Occultella glacieicola]|nr:hypothetical protein [Occultella glacieicola]
MSHPSPIEQAIEQQLPAERPAAQAAIDWIQPQLDLTITDLDGGEQR